MKTTKLTPNVIFKNEKTELNPGGNVEIFSKLKSFKKKMRPTLFISLMIPSFQIFTKHAFSVTVLLFINKRQSHNN